ncbi:hypothetical protein FHJ30_04295 [Arthrobacter sp. BB-1]|uniref:hypothetical protein n=1 Tax=unclassified Arthrobacter TaxID=235627 RepID=UPI001111F5B3|nr:MULTISPECIES: hypothetical protein [unclassified Arthrobacter]TNB75225.1 hypothetical protein FHJ30_04295 [Arthrobacter sp. BB-1]
MTFFQDFPIPPSGPRPATPRFVPPPWASPPAYELPVVVHLGSFLHHSPEMVMAVKSAEVFSTGCSFSLSWIIRRGEEDEDDWADKHALFFQPGMHLRRGTVPLSGLMFGVQFADGSKASTGARGPHGFMGSDDEPEPPTLVLNNGGGGGGPDELAGSGTLWLWPLPPAGNLRLVAQWIDFGMEESSVTLDGGQLRQAAEGVQRFWPDE